jgi:hypothetical protein
MALSVLFVTVSVLLAGDDPLEQDSTEQRQAIAVIQKLGGQVTASGQGSQAAVSVVLTGASEPLDCLPYLKSIANLRSCDL